MSLYKTILKKFKSKNKFDLVRKKILYGVEDIKINGKKKIL